MKFEVIDVATKNEESKLHASLSGPLPDIQYLVCVSEV